MERAMGARAVNDGGVRSVLADPEHLAKVAKESCADLPLSLRAPLNDAALRLADIFLHAEATLLEINPLFILADGSWVAGDVKLIIDDNAIPRQPQIRA